MEIFTNNLFVSYAIDISILLCFVLYMWGLVAETKDTLRHKQNTTLGVVREAINKGDMWILITILFVLSMGGLFLQLACLL